MKARGYAIGTWIIVFLTSSWVGLAQEYDDLYYTSADRDVWKKPAKVKVENDSRATYESYSNNTYDDNYTAKNVNPEYIARYRSQALSDNSISENPSYGTTDAEPLEYYPEEEIDNNTGSTIINNYYGDSPYRYAPNRWRFRNSFGFGYNPWWGWNSGFGFSAGWGNQWGWGGGWNDPFFSPFYGFYDPFFDPFFCPPGFGFFPRRNAFLAGYYNGFYGGGFARVAVVGEPVRARRRVAGARYVRGGAVSGVSRSTANRNTREINATRTQTITTNGRSARDYSQTQNEYYNRSRRSVTSSRSRNSITRSSTRPATTRASYNNASRSNARSSTINRSTQRTSRSRTGNVSTNRSSSRSSVNRSSTNSSRRYTISPNRNSSAGRSFNSNATRGNRSSGTFRAPSRSSSPSRNFTPRRSSSPSRSISPRSSGSRSSGSRSGGSRTSSSSRSRRN